MDNEYQLRCHLRDHTQEARRVCICANASFATSSKDRTVRFWRLKEPQGRDYTTSRTLRGHTSLVGALAWVPPNEEFQQGKLISGGMDIRVWDLATGVQLQLLEVLQEVNDVVLDGSDIICVSDDCKWKRWRGGQQVNEQVKASDAHQGPIQAIVKLATGELVTGSRDKTVKLWRENSCVHTFTGHTGGVQAVAVMPNLGILSASDDGSVRLWSLTGELLREMNGEDRHASIVYSVDAHASGLVVTGSKDFSAKIWKDGVCVQTIDHPGCVWDAKFLENGDIVTACSDSFVRVWTRDGDKLADKFVRECDQVKVESVKKDRIEKEIEAMWAQHDIEQKEDTSESESDSDLDPNPHLYLQESENDEEDVPVPGEFPDLEPEDFLPPPEVFLDFNELPLPVERPDTSEWVVAQMRPLETIGDVLRNRLGEVGIEFSRESYRFLDQRGLPHNYDYWTRERLQHILDTELP